MARIIIKCQAAPGFDGVFRAGRKWPAAGLEVETISAADDVEAEQGGVLKIGTKTLAALEGDPRFSFGIAGTIGEIEKVRAENEDLKARVAELEAKLAEQASKGEGRKGK